MDNFTESFGILTVGSGLGQVVVGPQRPDGLDHSHDELHLTVDLLAVPAELQQSQQLCRLTETLTRIQVSPLMV